MSIYNQNSNNNTKYDKNSNIFKATKSMVKQKPRDEIWRENLIDWITFYRRNVHRFIEHYFGISLHLYQIIWIYFMSICDTFVTIASRASAKSWLIAVFALARAVLYPNSEIVIVAATMKQAKIIFGKIGMLKNDYPNVAREIEIYRDTQNDILCYLHNGSKIKVVACGESGRRRTCNFYYFRRV